MIGLNSFWFAADFKATIVQVDRNKSVVGKISVFRNAVIVVNHVSTSLASNQLSRGY